MEKRNIAIALPVTGEEEWQAIKEPRITESSRATIFVL